MDLISSCGLPVASIVWQSAAGAWALTAVCKATFRLVPGTLALANVQEPPNEEDNYWNDDESRSLLAASDLVPFKPRADILVVGNAFAPRGTTVRSLVVRVTVGTIDKSLEVWCERWFEPSGRAREGAAFQKMPLRYERAAGGPDTTNPVGVPFDAPPDPYGRIPIANLQPAGAHVAFRGDTFSPVGLGPVAPHWPDRTARIYQRVPRGWHRDWHVRPLPESLDPAYFNAAPRDQQSEPLRPDERISLENLHPDHVRLVTRLPGLVPQAHVRRATGHVGRMDLVADTLWIDTDRSLCTVVWRGRIGLTHAREQGAITFTCEGLSEQMFEPAPPSALSTSEVVARPVPAEADVSMTLAPGLLPSGPAIPFETSPWVRSSMAEASGAPARASSDDAGGTVFLLPTNDGAATLPFVPPIPTPPAAPPQAAPPQPPPAPQPPATPSFQVRPVVSSPLASAPSEGTLGVSDTLSAPLYSESPEPPPMLGPLVTESMAARPKRVEVKSKPRENAAPEPVRAPEPPSGPKIEDYPIERCAKIAARLGCKPESAAEVLRAEDLDSAGWEKVHDHWQAAIRATAERRDKTLVVAYDRAYVSELEAQRGPITLDDYAALAEAAERGAETQAMLARNLPERGWPHVHRAWIERVIKDRTLGALVQGALASKRSSSAWQREP